MLQKQLISGLPGHNTQADIYSMLAAANKLEETKEYQHKVY